MFNDLPEGSTANPLAPFNDYPSIQTGKSALSQDGADRVIAEAIARMEAAGMKLVTQTIDGK